MMLNGWMHNTTVREAQSMLHQRPQNAKHEVQTNLVKDFETEILLFSLVLTIMVADLGAVQLLQCHFPAHFLPTTISHHK